MSDEVTEESAGTEVEQEASQEATVEPQGDEKPATDWQAQARKWESRAKQDKKTLDELKKEVKRLVSPEVVSDKDATIKEQADRIQDLELRDLRRAVGLEVGLDPRMFDRLKGTTEDEIRDDAEALKDLSPKKGKSDASKGTNPATPAPPANANDLLRQIVAGKR